MTENAPKKGKTQFPVAVRGSKKSVLNFPDDFLFLDNCLHHFGMSVFMSFYAGCPEGAYRV